MVAASGLRLAAVACGKMCCAVKLANLTTVSTHGAHMMPPFRGHSPWLRMSVRTGRPGNAPHVNSCFLFRFETMWRPQLWDAAACRRAPAVFNAGVDCGLIPQTRISRNRVQVWWWWCTTACGCPPSRSPDWTCACPPAAAWSAPRARPRRCGTHSFEQGVHRPPAGLPAVPWITLLHHTRLPCRFLPCLHTPDVPTF